MPMPFATLDLFSNGTWAMLLFGASSLGFGLFLGRILFGVPRMLDNPAPSTERKSSGTLFVDPVDLRAFPRTQVTQTKILLSCNTPQAEPFEGWVTDRSLGGLGLSVSQPVELGTLLHLLSDQLPEWVASPYLEVKYCRLQRGRWRLGCQYVNA